MSESTEEEKKNGAIGCGTLIACAVLYAMCSGGDDTPIATQSATAPPPAASAPKRWFEGGTLHKAKLSEWRNADAGNKLATAADWVLAFGDIKKAVMESGDVDNSKKFAQDLVTCIDKGDEGRVQGPDTKVAELAAICGTLMGWK